MLDEDLCEGTLGCGSSVDGREHQRPRRLPHDGTEGFRESGGAKLGERLIVRKEGREMMPSAREPCDELTVREHNARTWRTLRLPARVLGPWEERAVGIRWVGCGEHED